MKKLGFTLFLLLTCLSSQLEARITIGHSELQNLLAAYNFNRDNYGYIIDQSIFGMNGILNNNAKLIKGKYGNSLSLEDAHSSFVALKTETSHYIDIYADHTICAWVKIPEQEAEFTISLQFINPLNFVANRDIPISELETFAGTQLAIKSNGDLRAVSHSIFGDNYLGPLDEPVSEPPVIELPEPPVVDHDVPIAETKKLFFSNGHSVETQDQSINDDSWHHIALVYVDGYLKLYVDGALVCENGYYFKPLWELSYYITLLTVGDGATGVIDDLCVFNKALDDAFIDLLYKLGLDMIMTVANVAAKDKITTTWGDIKSRR